MTINDSREGGEGGMTKCICGEFVENDDILHGKDGPCYFEKSEPGSEGEKKHTPLPWQSDYAGNMITDCVPSHGYTFDKVIAKFNNWDDVPFVLKCVNNYDALEKQLEIARVALNYMAEFSPHCCEDCPCDDFRRKSEEALAAMKEKA